MPDTIFWSIDDNDEQLRHGELGEAIHEALEDMDLEDWPRVLKVYGYAQDGGDVEDGWIPCSVAETRKVNVPEWVRRECPCWVEDADVRQVVERLEVGGGDDGSC